MHRVTTSLLAVLVAVSALFLPLAAASAAPPRTLDTAAVDSFVTSYLEQHGLVGAQVAVVRDGETVHTAGYGTSAGAPMSTRIPMPLASVSKHVTALAMLQLVGAGVVELDAPVLTYLPELVLDDERTSQITVRQLLSHTSGLPNPTLVAPAADLREGVERIADVSLQSAPGTAYAYSNLNYHVAGRLIEVVSGQSLDEYLQEHLFEPLGMAHTRSVYTAHADDPGLQDGHVTLYGTALALPEMEHLIGAAGGVLSTAEDQALWLGMLTRGGTTVDGEQLIPADLLRASMAPQPAADGNGMGWHRSGEAVSPARVGHSGVTGRTSAQLDLVPSSGYGVVVMLNSYTTTLEHNYALSDGIIEITEGRTPSLGAPIPTIIDGVLGALTLVILLLATRGVLRAGRWAGRRAAWPAWRFGLRLLPQLIAPLFALWLFLYLPLLGGTSATPLDAFALWPAAAILLLAAGVAGAALTVARIREKSRAQTPGRV